VLEEACVETKLAEWVDRIANDEVHGASWLAKEAVEAISEAVELGKDPVELGRQLVQTTRSGGVCSRASRTVDEAECVSTTPLR
jgi:translation initiation factor 2B subunit (eIF-2B alpha/beta/delta family)